MKNQVVTPLLRLTDAETARLEILCNSRSVSILRARRAAMLLDFCNGTPVSQIARSFRTGCVEVERYIDRALRQEVLWHRDTAKRKLDTRIITVEMVAWVRDVSQQDPRALGHGCAHWSKSLLVEHIRNHCRAMGHHALADLKYGDMSQLMS